MKVFKILLLMIVFIPGQALASSCYSVKEAEAEQGLRIHSELMVIGLNCMAMPLFATQNLYGQYRNFTSEYSTLFEAYEDILLAYYKRNGVRDPQASLNTLRTNLANKISTDAADMRPDLFCVKFAPRIETAGKMSMKEVRKWASTFYPSHPVSKPLCEETAAVLAQR